MQPIESREILGIIFAILLVVFHKGRPAIVWWRRIPPSVCQTWAGEPAQLSLVHDREQSVQFLTELSCQVLNKLPGNTPGPAAASH